MTKVAQEELSKLDASITECNILYLPQVFHTSTPDNHAWQYYKISFNVNYTRISGFWPSHSIQLIVEELCTVDGNSECEFYTFIRTNQGQLRKMQAPSGINRTCGPTIPVQRSKSPFPLKKIFHSRKCSENIIVKS
jgi:hypothetical protein